MVEPTNNTNDDLQDGLKEAGREPEVKCEVAARVPRAARKESPSKVGGVKEAEQPTSESVASLPPNEHELERTSLHDAASLNNISTEQQTTAGRHQQDPSGIVHDLPSVDGATCDDDGDGEKKPAASLEDDSLSPPTTRDGEGCGDNESYSSDNIEARLSTDDAVKQKLKQTTELGGNCQADDLLDFKAQVRGERIAGSTKSPSRPGQAVPVKKTTTSKSGGPSFKDQVVAREQEGTCRGSEEMQETPRQDGGPDFKAQVDSRSETEGMASPSTLSQSDTSIPDEPANEHGRAASAERSTSTASSSDPRSCVHAVLVEEKSTVWADASPMQENGNPTTKRKWVGICVVVTLAFVGLALGLIFGLEQTSAESDSTNVDAAAAVNLTQYNCSLPGLETLAPGKYAGVQANYLSFATYIASPNFLLRAEEFEACTGGKIEISDANNIVSAFPNEGFDFSFHVKLKLTTFFWLLSVGGPYQRPWNENKSWIRALRWLSNGLLPFPRSERTWACRAPQRENSSRQ